MLNLPILPDISPIIHNRLLLQKLNIHLLCQIKIHCLTCSFPSELIYRCPYTIRPPHLFNMAQDNNFFSMGYSHVPHDLHPYLAWVGLHSLARPHCFSSVVLRDFLEIFYKNKYHLHYRMSTLCMLLFDSI